MFACPFFVLCGAVFAFHKRTIDKRRQLVLVGAFGVVAVVVCYFIAVFRGLVAVMVSRGVPLDLKKWNG